MVVHLLPELVRGQESVEGEGALGFLEHHVYIVAVLGLALFYGVELTSRRNASRSGSATSAFWVRMGSFAGGLIVSLFLYVSDADRRAPR